MRTLEIASFGMELAQGGVKGDGRTMYGYASVFNFPIDESTPYTKRTTYVKPGAFKKTLRENREAVQVLFNHGRDPRFGQLPIGIPTVMEERSRGLYTEAELEDQEIIGRLRSGALRAMSIQFETIGEDYNEDRTERYIREIKLWEFGPVTFPANQAAAASIHSLEAFAPGGLWIPDPELEAHAAVDRSAWDGNRALAECSSAADYRKICAGERAEGTSDERQHWALPHHYLGAWPAPNARGVAAARAALGGARGGAPAVTNLAAATAHLEAHERTIEAEASSSERRGTTLAGDRLTEIIRKGRKLEGYEHELVEQKARIGKLH